MFRVLPRASIATATAVLGVLVAAPALADGTQSSTIRIEPRPYYGAVVTIESGVRVFRPLPPTRHMIINPNNATPLAIQLKNGTKRVYRTK